jgi:hypothetical protein
MISSYVQLAPWPEGLLHAASTAYKMFHVGSFKVPFLQQGRRHKFWAKGHQLKSNLLGFYCTESATKLSKSFSRKKFKWREKWATHFFVKVQNVEKIMTLPTLIGLS